MSTKPKLPKWITRTIYVLSFCAAILALAFPSALEMSARADVFRTLAEIGGALIGLVGVIGVFGFSSLRSTLREIRKEHSQLGKIPIGTIEKAGGLDLLQSELKQLKNEEEEMVQRINTNLRAFAALIFAFLAQILTAIMGLGQVVLAGDWRFLLFLSFGMLFEGGFQIYLFARDTAAA